jgi:hypothetical protein
VLNNGELWGVHHVNVGGRAALRSDRINATTNALIESGYISDPSLAYFYGSIAVNDLGDVVIGMSGSGPSSYAGGHAVVGKAVGSVTTFGAPVQTRRGESDFVLLNPAGTNKWANYSSTTNDPADPSIFWTIQPYVAATDVWGTQVSEIVIPRPGEVRWKDSENGSFAADANWFGGVAPSAGSHVVFSRATDFAGSGYTVSFAPGELISDANSD